MFPIPISAYRLLRRIPLIGGSLSRDKHSKMKTTSLVYVSFLSVADLTMRCLLFAIIVGVGVIYLVQLNDRGKQNSDLQNANSNGARLRRIWELDEDQFESTLETVSVSQIVENWDLLEDSADGNFVLRIKQLQRKLRLAEKVAESATSQSAFGIDQKLLLRSMLWLLYQKLEQPSTELVRGLEFDLLQANSIHGQAIEADIEIGGGVVLAQFVCAVEEFLASDSDNRLVDYVNSSVDIAKLPLGDVRLATSSFQMAEFAGNLDSNFAIVEQLANHFSSSPNLEVRILVERYSSLLIDRLVDLDSVSKQQIDEVAAQLKSSLNSLSKSTEESATIIRGMTNVGLALVSLGLGNEVTEDVQRKLRRFAGSSADNTLAKQIQALMFRLQSVGTKFEPTELVQANGKPANLTIEGKQVVLFASNYRATESRNLLLQLIQNFGSSFLGPERNLTIVCLLNQSDRETIRDLNAFDKAHSYLEFGYLDYDTEYARGLDDLLGASSYPFLMLLEDGVIRLIDPPMGKLEQVFSKK